MPLDQLPPIATVGVGDRTPLTPATIDCHADQARPSHVPAVRGRRFIGVYEGSIDSLETLDVETWYTGTHLRQGQVSVSPADRFTSTWDGDGGTSSAPTDIRSPTSYESVAYRVFDGGRDRMVRFDGAVPVKSHPSDLRTRSLDEGLRELAPPGSVTSSPGSVGIVVAILVWLVRTLGLA